MLAIIEPVESYFICRPLLRDPAGEMVLEAPANGRADAIADNYLHARLSVCTSFTFNMMAFRVRCRPMRMPDSISYIRMVGFRKSRVGRRFGASSMISETLISALQRPVQRDEDPAKHVVWAANQDCESTHTFS